MERTAADAMPDDIDLTPQEPEPAETTTDTTAETPTETDANPLMALALKDLQEHLQERRDALERDIQELTNRKQQLEADLKTSFAGQSDAIAPVSYTHLTLPPILLV